MSICCLVLSWVSQVEKHIIISRDMCFLGTGTHITRDMWFPGRGTPITTDMCFQGRGTHITSE